MLTAARSGHSLTVGVLAGWQYYWTPTPLSYLNPIFRGIRQAAAALDLNLLLGCGMGSSATASDPLRPAWFTRSPDSDFVPIGPYNTDGLIVVNPLHTEGRSREIQALIAAGHPVVFVASGEHGSTVAADNRAGILAAVQHLFEHGHRQIAFIAGSQEDLTGDTGERLQAYRDALAGLQLDYDDRRCRFGRHTFTGGYRAMGEILSGSTPFTAVLASNDESALGAMQALREAGRNVPRDVAVIGFDDRPESMLQQPALSSVAVPLFEMGFLAVQQLVRQIQGQTLSVETVRVPTRLVVRESCGCRHTFASAPSLLESPDVTGGTNAEAVTAEEIRSQLTAAFETSIEQGTQRAFESVLDKLLDGSGTTRGDTAAWELAFDVVCHILFPRARACKKASRVFAVEILQDAQSRLAEAAWRSQRQFAADQRWTFDRLGLLTARLLNALDESQVYEVLAEYLPRMGIEFAALAYLKPQDDDPGGAVELRTIVPRGDAVIVAPTHGFPPPGLLPAGRAFSLALLPLVNPRGPLGFVAFGSDQLELYGSIVQELAAALHSAQLYAEAQEGRRLAEEATLMKSRFLSTVSHELRTPLNLIVGLSEILLREDAAGPAARLPASLRDLQQLHANAQHLSRLISDVLDLASSDAGRLRLSCQYVDLGPVLHEVAETGRRLALDKGLRWLSDLPESGAWVWGDRTRLSQVAMNLVSNAIKFTARGEVRLALELTGGSAIVRVSDTGLGISPEARATIFDEFRRSERSIERGYGGLGLGLAICKRLIELQGGTIDVQSSGEEGSGSVFFFTLPLLGYSPQRMAAPGLAPTEAGVLILTTAASTSERLRDHLNARGIEVQLGQIDEPASWQSHLLTAVPSAIVLDVSLASDQGWHVLRMLKADPATQSIPVLFYALSQERTALQNGSADPESAAPTASLFELDYLTKPIELADLTRALDQHWLAVASAQPARRFLVVDDDPDTLEMHARIVQGQSPTHQVFKARNGLEALRVLQHERIDLVLLDLIMPEMDGFAVLEAMRESPALRDIPVIVVTGQTLSEPDMARLNLGVTKVLSKGVFSLEETLSHLETALARRRELSGEAQRLVRQAMAYMQARYAEPLSREKVAAHVGLSDDYLTSCFRKELGLTPVAYLNRYRVQQAKRLLKNTHQSITEIALEVGFSGSSYFSRIFHRETGMTPAEYRRA